jgi:hypothetical protein
MQRRGSAGLVSSAKDSEEKAEHCELAHRHFLSVGFELSRSECWAACIMSPDWNPRHDSGRWKRSPFSFLRITPLQGRPHTFSRKS